MGGWSRAEVQRTLKRRDMKKLADSFEAFLRLLEPRLVISADELEE